jgi:hypothetical protein
MASIGATRGPGHTRALARATLRAALAGSMVAASLLCAAPPAHAHALLAKAEPAQRARLTRAPARVRLWFNERLEPAFSKLWVEDASGRPVTDQPARVAADAPKMLELELPALPPGRYTVRFQVLSVDGHTVKSGYSFSVKPP